MSLSVCVCVYHLNRCKTSDWFSLICRGAVNLIPSTAQRRRWFEIVISGLIIPTYLRLYFSDIARGQAKNPNHNLIQFAALLSRLVCMFQDSVPDGSYNDPFLSSVISMVAPTWCHGAN